MSEGSCVRCGRALKNEESRRVGMGPTCAAKCGSRAEAGNLWVEQPVLDGVGPLVECGLVCKRLADGRAATNVPQVIKHHSPTGFEWGYGGSGPADLALNVLHLLLPPTSYAESIRVDGVTVRAQAYDLHQSFKWEFISVMPREGGIAPLKEMRDWIYAKSLGRAA